MSAHPKFSQGQIDLRRSVLAENISVAPYVSGAVKVSFDFLCPNCGQRHWASEITNRRFSYVGWALDCGEVRVRMPWMQTPSRDKKSIYGQDSEGPEIISPTGQMDIKTEKAQTRML